MYLLSLCLLLFSSVQANDTNQIAQRALIYDRAQKSFHVYDQGKVQAIQRCFMDKLLRDIPADKMDEAINHLAFRMAQMDNGEYALHAHARGLGGGAGSAFALFWGTKIAVHLVANGLFIIIAAPTGPFAPAVFNGLRAATIVPVEALSTTLATASAVAGLAIPLP